MKKGFFLILITITLLSISVIGCENGTTDEPGLSEGGSPEITISINGEVVENGATIDIGSAQIFKAIEISGTITNNGDGELDLGEFSLTGDNLDTCEIISVPDTVIAAGGSTDFCLSINVGTEVGTQINVLSVSNNDSDESNYTLILSVASEARSWSEKETPSAENIWSARNRHSSVVYHDKIWVLGGYDGSYCNDVWTYDEDKNLWDEVEDKDGNTRWSGRTGFGCVVYHDKIWVIGGVESGSNYCNDVWSYDESENEWVRDTKNYPKYWPAREDFSCVVYNDKIWLLGGFDDSDDNFYNDVWTYDEVHGWDQVVENNNDDDYWSGRYTFGCVVCNDKIWVLGGIESDFNFCNDVWSYDEEHGWNQDAENNVNENYWEKRGYMGATAYNNMIWILGGYYSEDIEDGDCNDVWYSNNGSEWNEIYTAAEWEIRESMVSLVFNDKIWLLGGYINERYFANDVWCW